MCKYHTGCPAVAAQMSHASETMDTWTRLPHALSADGGALKATAADSHRLAVMS